MRTPSDGDILIEYHPHSKKEPCIISTQDYKATLNKQSKLTKPPDDKPWLPFSSREEFDFAELVHDAALNQKQIDTLIKLIGRCQEVPGAFTFRNYSDLKRSLDEASKLLTRVSTFSDLSRTNYLSPVGATLPLTIPSTIACGDISSKALSAQGIWLKSGCCILPVGIPYSQRSIKGAMP